MTVTYEKVVENKPALYVGFNGFGALVPWQKYGTETSDEYAQIVGACRRCGRLVE
jgi:hypothetical protein